MEFFKVSNHLIVVGNLTDADEEQTDLTDLPSVSDETGIIKGQYSRRIQYIFSIMLVLVLYLSSFMLLLQFLFNISKKGFQFSI